MAKPNPPRCGAELRDQTPCKAAGLKDWNGRCLHHGAIELGAQLGYRIRGSRRAGVYVGEKDSQVLVADTATELLSKIRAAA